MPIGTLPRRKGGHHHHRFSLFGDRMELSVTDEALVFPATSMRKPDLV